MYHHIREFVVLDFFPKGLTFLSFVFTVLPKHIRIKSLSQGVTE